MGVMVLRIGAESRASPLENRVPNLLIPFYMTFN